MLAFRLVVVLLLFVFVGCSTPNRSFLQKSHRELFLIEPEELKRLQFYVSNDIVVQNQSAIDAGMVSTEDVIIMRAGTPGVVLGVGDNWLRVSFQEGGRGVPRALPQESLDRLRRRPLHHHGELSRPGRELGRSDGQLQPPAGGGSRQAGWLRPGGATGRSDADSPT